MSNVSALVLISDAQADCQANSSNVSAPVLISADLCRMSQLWCSFPMQMQIFRNVSAPVLIFADLCRMSQLWCSFPMQMQISTNVLAPVLIFVDDTATTEIYTE